MPTLLSALSCFKADLTVVRRALLIFSVDKYNLDEDIDDIRWSSFHCLSC